MISFLSFLCLDFNIHSPFFALVTLWKWNLSQKNKTKQNEKRKKKKKWFHVRELTGQLKFSVSNVKWFCWINFICLLRLSSLFHPVTTMKINAKCWQRNMPKHILPSARFHSTKGRKVDKLSVNPVFFLTHPKKIN